MKKDRLGDLQYAILIAISIAGILAIGAMAPNAIQLLGHLDNKKKDKERDKPRYAINRSTKALIARGLVEYVDGRQEGVQLTLAGKKLLCKIDLGKIEYKTSDTWDGKWRVVIFDILERQRYKRAGLRKILQQIGFVRLQQSVWVFPYTCEKLVELLRIEQDLGRSVIYMVVDSIENDGFLKDKFGL